MKKIIVFLLLFVLCISMAGMGAFAKEEEQEVPLPTGASLELTVVIPYGENDAAYADYNERSTAWEKTTGNTVIKDSFRNEEEWKAKINEDFNNGTEPDVLFFFSGKEADNIVNGGKVVSLEEIRAEYPNYASNMRADLMPRSPADGQNYVVPVNGTWASMYINPAILEECGVTMPDGNYKWEQFLEDCQRIRESGYIPISVSLMESPDYWFEFMIMNHGSVENQLDIPSSVLDEAGRKWVSGLNDIKTLFDMGFIPKDMLNAMESETKQLMYSERAAFMIGGNGMIGEFEQNVPDRMNDFAVSYVPAQGERKASDIIARISTGYYITRKAWDDPVKRSAAVSFVDWMTRDDAVRLFSGTQITALKDRQLSAPIESNNLVDTALEVALNATGISGSVQDYLTEEAKAELFANVKRIATGEISASDVVSSVIELN